MACSRHPVKMYSPLLKSTMRVDVIMLLYHYQNYALWCISYNLAQAMSLGRNLISFLFIEVVAKFTLKD